VDLVLVIGSSNSSNSNRLVEVAEKSGTTARLIDDSSAIQPQWLEGVQSIGITAGASSPELLVAKVMNHLHDHGFTEIQQVETVLEDVHFALPPELETARQR
jgi:4-hydroxy-3-methylbut-2-enyl diphosphate reductase